MPYSDKEVRLQYNRNYTQGLTVKRQRSGLCVNCGKSARIGKTQCQQCFERRMQKIKVHRRQNKRKAVEYLGGKCFDCGFQTSFVTVYDFHHKDAANKGIEITDLMRVSKSWERIQAEIDKCILLCANCHRIRHEIEDNEPP